MQNAAISGDLLIADTVGNGDVTIRNVTVKGATTIKGGGLNTVKIDNCVLGKTVINKSDGNIRVLLSGTTSIVIAGKIQNGTSIGSSSSSGHGHGGSISTQKELIVKNGCMLKYVEIFGQTRARVETTDDVTGVTANGNNMRQVDGKWQFDLDGNVSSVTIVATDGTNRETYILNR